MKKILLFATSALLLLAGCAKEVQSPSDFDGELQEVTFAASLPVEKTTKAVADGDGEGDFVNRCIMEIYYGDELFDRQYAPVTTDAQGDKVASFTAKVAANREYKVAFWADYVESTTEAGLQVDKYYDTRSDDGLKAVTLKGTYAGNIDARDAFFHCGDYTISQTGTVCNATLYRPFAQVNVITTDLQTIKPVPSLKPDGVGVTVYDAYKTFNVLTGDVSNQADLNYTASLYNFPAEIGTSTDATLSMDYLFAASGKSLINIDWEATKSGNDDVEHSFANIPYQRNYRTNIKGALLSAQGQWNVTVDPVWNTSEHNVVVVAATVADIDGMNTFVANNSSATQYDVTFSQQPNDAGTPGVDAGAHAVLTTPLSTGDVMNVSVETNTETLYVGDYENQNSTTLTTGATNAATVNINVPAGKMIETLVINAPSKSVYLNGALVASVGTLTNVEATTSANTLVIEANQSITGKLIVHQGGLEIHGSVTALGIRENDHSNHPVKVRACENLSQAVFDSIYVAGDHDYIDRPTYVQMQNGSLWNIVPAVCKIGEQSYASLTEAYTAAVDGNTIVLLQDQTTERINNAKDITVDLNGHVLTGTSAYNVVFGLTEGKTLTITGTTEGSKIIGTIMVSHDKKGNLTVNGGTYENDLYCPFYVNGACLDGNTWNISNATIIGNRNANANQEEAGFGCYHAGRSTTKFLNCTITGVRTGVEVRAGSVRLENCTVTGETDESKFSANPNLNGGVVIGAAVSVSQHYTDYITKAVTKNSTLVGYYALYEKDLENETGRENISMDSGVTKYNGLIYSQNCAPFIDCLWGGFPLFSDAPDESYLYSGTKGILTHCITANTDNTTNCTYPYTVASKILPGSGTADDPYLLYDVADLKVISAIGAGQYYALGKDIELTDDVFVRTQPSVDGKYVVSSISGVLDGCGHTLTFPAGEHSNQIGVCGQLQGTIQNLKVVFQGDGVVAQQTHANAVFDNVDVSGKLLHFDGNDGAYCYYAQQGVTFEDCDCSVDITGTGGELDYNAVFVGYYYSGNTVFNFIFRNCTYSGKMVCGRSSMFLANPNNININMTVENCTNAGTIISTYVADNYKMNYYYSHTTNNTDSFTLNGTQYSGVATDQSWVPYCWEDNLVTTTGSASNGPVQTGMAISRNADKQFVVTPATGGKIGETTVDHYQVRIGLYVGVDSPGSGSSRQYATETISPDGSASYTTVMKDWKFVDRTYVGTGEIVTVGDNDTFTDASGSYFVIASGYSTGSHQPESATMYSVSAFDANGVLLATASLTE